MPVHEFTCNVCKAPLSVFVPTMSSEINAKCEKCGSSDLSRAISGFAFLGASRSQSDGGLDEADVGLGSMMQQMGGMGGMDDFGGF